MIFGLLLGGNNLQGHLNEHLANVVFIRSLTVNFLPNHTCRVSDNLINTAISTGLK